MPQFMCQHCSGAYQMAPGATGTTVKCPHCGKQTEASADAPAQSKSGVAEIAEQYTRRMELQAVRPGYTSWKVWSLLLASIGICAALHTVLLLFSVMFKPVPVVAVLWAPVLAGTFGGYVTFSKSASIGVPRLPIWTAAAGIVICLVLTVVPTLLAQDIYVQKARRSLHLQVNALLRLPDLPETVPGCSSVLIKRGESGGSIVTAYLSDEQQHDLAAEVSFFKGSLVRDASVRDMLCRLAEAEVPPALKECIKGYAHLEGRALKSISINKVVEVGVYAGTTQVESGPVLEFTATAGKDRMQCTLTRTSHIRAAAMPQVALLWQQFEPDSDAVCVDVTLTAATAKTRRRRKTKTPPPAVTRWEQATAALSNNKKLPIIVVAEARGETEAPADVKTYFQFREAAIIQINKELTKINEMQGRDLSDRCINIEDKQGLRANEISLKAIFPEAEVWVLLEQTGYELEVLPGEYAVMVPLRKRVKDSWSLLVPAHYARSKVETAGVSRASAKDMLMLTLVGKPLNAYAQFSLRDYADRERSEWETEHEAMIVGELEPFPSRSGLKGYCYTTRQGTALRMKYFFVKAGHLAIITGVSNKEADHTAEASDGIVASLRFADVAKEDDVAR